MTDTADPRPGGPVSEAKELGSDRIARERMFKPAMDPARRIPDAPDPTDEAPRPGARGRLGIVYGPRSIRPQGRPSPEPPRNTSEIPSADRAGLRSVARQSRRFRLIALAGGAGVLLGVLTCLWWISQIAWN